MKVILTVNGSAYASAQCNSDTLMSAYCGLSSDEDHSYDYRPVTDTDQYPMTEHYIHEEIRHSVSLYDYDDYTEHQNHLRELGVFNSDVDVYSKNLSTVQLAHLIQNACSALQSNLYHQQRLQPDNELLEATVNHLEEASQLAKRVSDNLTPSNERLVR